MSTQSNNNRKSDTQHEFFSADRPIKRKEEDKLNRESFAEAVAEAVYGWHGRDSLIIALYGPWGTGKTSIKNLIVESLTERFEGDTRIAQFNPWQFANSKRLTESFFDEIGIALGKGDIGSKKSKAKLLKKWRKYATYFSAGEDIVKRLRKLFIGALIVVGTGLLGLSIPDLGVIPIVISVILFFLAAGLKFSKGTSHAVERIISAGLEKTRESIEDVKAKLTDDLKD
jgi:Cdc6-like AAA superfamily ATPase